MNLLDKCVPSDSVKRRWMAVLVTALVAGLLTVWGIYGIEEYGVAMFILTPMFIGACSTIIYGLKSNISFRDAWETGFLALGVFTAGLVVFAIEGLICIIMMAPLGIFLTWIGSIIGYALVKKKPGSAPTVILLLLGSIPTMSFFEKDSEPELTSVVTSIEVNADPQTVWKNVVAFPQLEEPSELLFKAGIAYPINAKIEGTGVGAVRHCNFTTGSFVEPVTVWDEPRLLKFNVAEQPAPMKELSFWDIDAPHLHDYFVSKQGQFRLSQLPNGNTLLEGTTWYYHNIRPAFYWRPWSNYIIHKIHDRVLKHIKTRAEIETSLNSINR
jgi:hypothetical protein